MLTAQDLLDFIDTTKTVGLRAQALIGVMVFRFARVGAVLGMNTEDYSATTWRSRPTSLGLRDF